MFKNLNLSYLKFNVTDILSHDTSDRNPIKAIYVSIEHY